MPAAGPAPSRAAIHALRGLVFGTSFSLALVAEERRRRTDIAWTVVENGRLLRSQRCYHSGGLATVRARFDAAAATAAATAGLATTWDDAEIVPHGDEAADSFRLGGYRPLDEDTALEMFALGNPYGGAPGRRSVPVFENIKSFDAYTPYAPQMTGAEKRQKLADEIEAEQDPFNAALKKLVAAVGQAYVNSRELQTLFNNAYAASKGLRFIPDIFLELSRTVQGLLLSRGEAVDATKMLLVLVKDARINNAVLLQHRPVELIAQLLSLEDMFYMPNESKFSRFQLAGELLAGLNAPLKKYHSKRHHRMCDMLCRVLKLDQTGAMCTTFITACGDQAAQISLDISAHYAANFTAEELQHWDSIKCAAPQAAPANTIRFVTPVRHYKAIDNLMANMKASIRTGRLEEAVQIFEKHVHKKGRKSSACLSLAVQMADSIAGKPLGPRTISVLRKAARAKYDFREDLSRSIGRWCDALETQVSAEQYGPDCMYPRAMALLASIKDFARDPGVLAYNRLARTCLRMRDYMGAVRLMLASIKMHGKGDLFFHPFVISNMVFALSALKEYNLLEILVRIVDTTALNADATVKAALGRARKRVAAAVGSALWDKTRVQHLRGLQVLDDACQRMRQRRASLELSEPADSLAAAAAADAQGSAESPEDGAWALPEAEMQQQQQQQQQEEEEAVPLTPLQVPVDTDLGAFSREDLMSLLHLMVEKWQSVVDEKSRMAKAKAEVEQSQAQRHRSVYNVVTVADQVPSAAAAAAAAAAVAAASAASAAPSKLRMGAMKMNVVL